MAPNGHSPQADTVAPDSAEPGAEGSEEGAQPKASSRGSVERQTEEKEVLHGVCLFL